MLNNCFLCEDKEIISEDKEIISPRNILNNSTIKNNDNYNVGEKDKENNKEDDSISLKEIHIELLKYNEQLFSLCKK